MQSTWADWITKEINLIQFIAFSDHMSCTIRLPKQTWCNWQTLGGVWGSIVKLFSAWKFKSRKRLNQNLLKEKLNAHFWVFTGGKLWSRSHKYSLLFKQEILSKIYRLIYDYSWVFCVIKHIFVFRVLCHWFADEPMEKWCKGGEGVER